MLFFNCILYIYIYLNVLQNKKAKAINSFKKALKYANSKVRKYKCCNLLGGEYMDIDYVLGVGYSKVSLLYSTYDEERREIYKRIIDNYKIRVYYLLLLLLQGKYEELIPYLQLQLNICINEDEKDEINKEIKDYSMKIDNKKMEIERMTKEDEEEKKEAELIKQLTTLHEFSIGLFDKYSRVYSKAFEYVNQEKYNEVLYIYVICTFIRQLNILRML